MIHIVGGGLSGCLLAFELQRRGVDFTLYDVGSGATSSRVAAGIFNPLTGPRFSKPDFDWNSIGPYYEELQRWLGVEFLHWAEICRPMPLPNPAKKIHRPPSALEGPGWVSHWKMVELPEELHFEGKREGTWQFVVSISGGGWVDVPVLIEASAQKLRAQGRWIDRRFEAAEAEGKTVVWCGGIQDFVGPEVDRKGKPLEAAGVWKSESWQAVKGEILTVRIPAWSNFIDTGLPRIWIDKQFLIALDNDGLFRFGSTHVWDDFSLQPTQAGLEILTEQLKTMVRTSFEVVEHVAGVRPASRTLEPLIKAHPHQQRWFLFNGFSGRGVSRIPIEIFRLINLLKISKDRV